MIVAFREDHVGPRDDVRVTRVYLEVADALLPSTGEQIGWGNSGFHRSQHPAREVKKRAREAPPGLGHARDRSYFWNLSGVWRSFCTSGVLTFSGVISTGAN